MYTKNSQNFHAKSILQWISNICDSTVIIQGIDDATQTKILKDYLLFRPFQVYKWFIVSLFVTTSLISKTGILIIVII